MKLLLTGAHGQVGTSLARTAPKGADVIALARADLDIADASAVAARVRGESPDLIVNAAAYTAVDKAESEPERAREANELGPRNLAAAAADSGVRLIHISTDFVFDGSSSRPYEPAAAPNPLGAYGATKLEGERAVRRLLPDRSVVLRTAWVYSAGGGNFVRTMLRLMRERGQVRVVADQIGTPTAADSIAEAIWAITAVPDFGGICHWTDAGVASWYDFAVAIAEEATACGYFEAEPEVTPITSAEYPTPAQRPAFSVLDWRATRDVIGITPKHWRVNLRRVLREIVSG